MKSCAGRLRAVAVAKGPSQHEGKSGNEKFETREAPLERTGLGYRPDCSWSNVRGRGLSVFCQSALASPADDTSSAPVSLKSPLPFSFNLSCQSTGKKDALLAAVEIIVSGCSGAGDGHVEGVMLVRVRECLLCSPRNARCHGRRSRRSLASKCCPQAGSR